VILVDSSDWIDFFHNRPSVQAEWLDRNLGIESLVIGDLTVRGTVNVIIATRCLSEGFRLLHSDRDFDAFEEHLGLQVVDCGA
jgi:predicted nucleic acid-binding protein